MAEIKEGTIYGAEGAPVIKNGGNTEIQDAVVTEVQDPKSVQKADPRNDFNL